MCRANDVCKESKRQTINADDVFKALEEIEFPEFVVPLKASLEGQSVSIIFVLFISPKVNLMPFIICVHYRSFWVMN